MECMTGEGGKPFMWLCLSEILFEWSCHIILVVHFLLVLAGMLPGPLSFVTFHVVICLYSHSCI